MSPYSIISIIPSLSSGWYEVILFNLVCDRVEDQSREKAKANATYCVTISDGMRIDPLRRSKTLKLLKAKRSLSERV
jgi:hypothetical protein